MKVLIIDSCIKPGEESRTRVLLNSFEASLKEAHPDCEIEKLVLSEEKDLVPFTYEMVMERYGIVERQEWDNNLVKYAKQFASADRVVIAAPYWDMAFPSILKIYIEHIFVGGICFKSTPQGLKPITGIEKALFIQTSGGYVGEDDPGSKYLEYTLSYLGPQEYTRIAADGIDVVGADVEGKMNEAKQKLAEYAAAI